MSGEKREQIKNSITLTSDQHCLPTSPYSLYSSNPKRKTPPSIPRQTFFKS